MRTLIVYYSLGGNTAYAAERIAHRIGADTLRLVPAKEYSGKGLKKYVVGGKSVMFAEKPELIDYDVNLAKYDHIIFGFPVWASNFAPPLRTFISEHKAILRRKEIYAFACQKASGAEKAMARLRKFIRVNEFNVEGVFIEPKRNHSKETDAIIDEFSDALIELGAGNRKGQPLHRRVRAMAKSNPRQSARNYFSNWNYKKHAKLCAAVYLPLIIFDLTISYVIFKKVLDRLDQKRAGREE